MIKKISILKFIYIILILCFISISNISCVHGALYLSRGDKIPLATIEYDEKDNASVFPESYRAGINELKKAHPNWTFMAVYTNLDWFDSIRHESYEVNEGISLVPMTFDSVWKKDGVNHFQDGSWVTASKAAVAYAMDPRNYLNENTVFQFESLSCIEGVHTVEAVEKVLASTDLKTNYTKNESGKTVVKYPTYTNTNGVSVTMNKTYAQIIYEAGVESKVSPIHIATRIIQETGGSLSNGSICGTNPNFLGYYNFFNIGSVPGADGNSAVTNGLINAKNNGWDSPEKSIKAGALTLYNSYIKYGQDTVYFQKFDVSNSKGNATMLYACQYMTNIIAPASEAKLTYAAYSDLGILDSSFVFYVPVYKNRTKQVSPLPGGSIDNGNIENDNKQEAPKEVKVKSIAVSKTSYSIAKGKSVTIPVTILPENATNKNYTAVVSNSAILKVDKNKITALSEGEATVKFKSEDGGFETLVKVKVTEKEDFNVDTEKLNINENNQIIGIKEETSLSEITKHITMSDTIKMEIKNINGDKLENSARVGTGTVITLVSSDSTVLCSYTVVVNADVNGDGKISASDYVLIKNYIMGTNKLSDSQVLASDVNKDGKTSAPDYVLIKNHIMGVSKLN